METLCGLVALGLMGGGVWWLVSTMSAQNNAWNALVAEHGLQVTYRAGGHRKVTGSIGKTAFTYEADKEWSHVIVPIPREEMGDLHVGHEHIIAKLAKKLGGQDITFDEPVFDDRWRVTCSRPEIARRILTRPVRVALHNTQTDLGRTGFLEVREGQLWWATQGLPGVDALPGIVRALGKCARKFAPKKPKESDAVEGEPIESDPT